MNTVRFVTRYLSGAQSGALCPNTDQSFHFEAVGVLRRETDQLATLDSVGPKRAEFAAALASTRRLADVLGSFLHQLRSGVVELVAYTQVQTDSRALTAEINAHFRQAGLTRCVA